MEVEAVDGGIMGKIIIPAGTESVKVNALIAVLLEEGEDKKALELVTARNTADALAHSTKKALEERLQNALKTIEKEDGLRKGLEEKLSAMDQLVSKIDNLETNIEKMRPKTSQEKLELRSLDSGPFNQKLSDFFTDKQEDFEKTGKEYVLTTDDVEQYSGNQIKDSFTDYEDNEEDTEMM
jgi:pyruvate/2-oxoglutarate dehydrogenase complex dihydrolipoamide acyltransferase (E2) component